MRNTWILCAVTVLLAAGCGKDKATESGGASGGPSGKAVDNASPPAKTYTVKLKVYPDMGKTIRLTATESQKGTQKVSGPNGVAKDMARDEVSERSCTLSVVEAGSPKPQKYKETYDKAVQKTGGNTTVRPLQGKTIVYDSVGEKYQLTVEGGALPKQDLDPLKTAANKGSVDESVVPTGAVKVGETWKVDPQKAGGTLTRGAEVDAGKSTAEAKLVRVYDKDGKPYAVIEYKLHLAYKRAEGLLFNPPLILDATGTVDTVRDGSSTYRKSTMNAKLAGKGHPDQKGATGITIELEQTVTADEERSAEK